MTDNELREERDAFLSIIVECRAAAGFGGEHDPINVHGFGAFGDPAEVPGFIRDQFRRLLAEVDGLRQAVKDRDSSTTCRSRNHE